MCGPYGVRVIDRGLLNLVQYNVGIIKDVVKEAQPVLTALQGRFTERGFFFDSLSKINRPALDKLLRHSVVIGCILKFRETLRDALQEVVKERTPFIFEAVKLAHSQLPDNSQVDPRLMALDYLAQDCGVDVKEADHSLRNSLQKYKTQPQDAQLWGLLPELYGISFVSARWHDAHYLIESEGHANNSHCIVPTIHSLISAFERMPLKNEVVPNVNEIIQLNLERFVRCAAHSILHITSDPTHSAGFPLVL
jgi:hypothetical protein